MEEKNNEKTVEQLLGEEREALLAEVKDAVERKKALIKKDEEKISYRKRRY